jgi:hypothetical protein
MELVFMELQPLVCADDIRKLYTTPNTQTVVHDVSPCKQRKNKAGLWAYVEYTVDNFRALLGVTGNAVNRARVPDVKVRVMVPVEYLPAALLPESVQDSNQASTSALVDTAKPPQTSSSMDLTSPSQSSASPDPPLRILKPHPEIMEITDSDSEVEIVRSPHPCRRSFSPEFIIISD